MNTQELILRIEQERLIVIVRGVKNEQLIPLAEAMYRGGIRLLEVTYSANGSTPDTETAEGICMLKSHFGNRMAIGAGTVLTEEQVELTHRAGGEFIISPDTCEAVIKKTKELGLVSIPGALTPTEAQNASRAGADFVKLFPVTSLGPAYVRAIRAPLSHIRFLAVGGIDTGNMAEYLSAGACGFGISSGIVDNSMLAKGDFEAITKLAKQYIAALGGKR